MIFQFKILNNNSGFLQLLALKDKDIYDEMVSFSNKGDSQIPVLKNE